MQICPKCHSAPLLVRTDREAWRGWIRCDVCRYMEKEHVPQKDNPSEEIRKLLK